MKLQLTLLVGAACTLTGVAHGQVANDQQPGVQLREVPGIGAVLRAGSAPPRAPFQTPRYNPTSLFGSRLPPIPRLDASQNAGTRVQVLKIEDAEILQVEIVRQSIADVLKEITLLMGARAVIDPQLGQEQLSARVVRARDWDELLHSFGEAVEVVKSPEDTYFFAARPYRLSSISYSRMPDGTYQRLERFTRSRELPLSVQNSWLAPEPSQNSAAVPDFGAPKNPYLSKP